MAANNSTREVRRISPEGRAVMEAIRRKAAEMGVTTDSQLVKRYLTGVIDYSTWNRIDNDRYTGQPDGYIPALREAYASMSAMKARREKPPVMTAADFFHTATTRAVFNAVETANSLQENWQREQSRLVCLFAPFGSGKSELCAQLAKRYGFYVFRATEAWRHSYCAGLKAICRGLGLDTDARSAWDLEDTLFTMLRSKHYRIAIDDANTFAPHTCNMVRDILNETPTVVFVCGIESFEEQLKKRAWDEAGQMFSRSVANLRAAPITGEYVANFLKSPGMDGVGAACNMIAGAANTYGGFRFVRHVAARLNDKAAAAGRVTMDDVVYAVGFTEQLLRTQRQAEMLKRRAA